MSVWDNYCQDAARREFAEWEAAQDKPITPHYHALIRELILGVPHMTDEIDRLNKRLELANECEIRCDSCKHLAPFGAVDDDGWCPLCVVANSNASAGREF